MLLVMGKKDCSHERKEDKKKKSYSQRQGSSMVRREKKRKKRAVGTHLINANASLVGAKGEFHCTVGKT